MIREEKSPLTSFQRFVLIRSFEEKCSLARFVSVSMMIIRKYAIWLIYEGAGIASNIAG